MIEKEKKDLYSEIINTYSSTTGYFDPRTVYASNYTLSVTKGTLKNIEHELALELKSRGLLLKAMDVIQEAYAIDMVNALKAFKVRVVLSEDPQFHANDIRWMSTNYCFDYTFSFQHLVPFDQSYFEGYILNQLLSNISRDIMGSNPFPNQDEPEQYVELPPNIPNEPLLEFLPYEDDGDDFMI